MRTAGLLLLAVLLGLAPGRAGQAADLPGGDVWLQHVTRDLLPFWAHPDATGEPPGAFPTFRCNDGSRYRPERPCPELAGAAGWIRSELGRDYLRMQARQTFAYGAAFHLTGDPRWLALARAGAEHALRHLDPARGAPAWLEGGKPAGAGAEATAQDQAYAVVGIAMVYVLTREPRLEKALLDHQRWLFHRFRDPERGLLRWMPPEGPPGERDRLELVAQLDPLNAYMLLVLPYLPEPARRAWAADVRWLCDVLVTRFLDPESGTFLGTLGRPDSRAPGARHNDFGHTIKAWWMLLLAARELGDDDLAKLARDGAARILDRAWHPASGAWGSSWTADGIEADKTWWIFAELDQAAATLALEDRRHAERLERSWRFWLERMVDPAAGEVWPWVRADGTPPSRGVKIFHWKSGYHSMEHALVSYLAAQALAGRTATLHFATGREDAAFRPYLLPGTVESVRRAGSREIVTFRLPTPGPAPAGPGR
jgi:mannose/cellobiose epimerase-like protein (N-acyl-D-glucosamine 2-epimerase family)